MGKFVIVGLVISWVLAVFLSPFASQLPDGLEKVADNLGFIHKGRETQLIRGPVADYTMSGVASETISTSLAGIAGVIITFTVTFTLGMLLKKKK